MSVLLPETQRVLRTCLVEPKRPRHHEVDAVPPAELRAWMASQPHVAWCGCKACREKRLDAETVTLAEHLEREGGP